MYANKKIFWKKKKRDPWRGQVGLGPPRSSPPGKISCLTQTSLKPASTRPLLSSLARNHSPEIPEVVAVFQGSHPSARDQGLSRVPPASLNCECLFHYFLFAKKETGLSRLGELYPSPTGPEQGSVPEPRHSHPRMDGLSISSP